MTEQNIKTLAEGIELHVVDLEGANRFLKTERAHGAGMALLLAGELSPGKANASIISGHPIAETIVASADRSLALAGIVSFSPYYDRRHAEYLAAKLMLAISTARGMTPNSEDAARLLQVDNVPFADIDRMDAAAQVLVSVIDEAMNFPVISQAA